MNILIPTDEKFVEQVAKSIARDRLHREASDLMQHTMGITLPDSPEIDARFDREFEKLWTDTDDESVWNKTNYMTDAATAINKINLLLLTMPIP